MGGPNWCAWQEVWLGGLRGLRERIVIVVACSENFENKFKRKTSDEENRKNFFDATYELPAGKRAENILDWERRHVAMCAAQNDLSIRFVDESPFNRNTLQKPEWYSLPEDFALSCGFWDQMP